MEADAKLARRVGKSILTALHTNLDCVLSELADMGTAWQDGSSQEIDLSILKSFRV